MTLHKATGSTDAKMSANQGSGSVAHQIIGQFIAELHKKRTLLRLQPRWPRSSTTNRLRRIFAPQCSRTVRYDSREDTGHRGISRH